MSLHRKKRRKRIEYKEIELNIMPFVDVFSMLNTFLLFSAVFIMIGITEVQIPFLTNAPPPKEKSARFLNINIDVTKEKIEIVRTYSMPPADEMKWEFTFNKDGIEQMHRRLVSLRKEDPDIDKVTLFSDDDVIYKDLSNVLDAIKLRFEGDPIFAVKSSDKKEQEAATIFLYPKIVMGSVML